MPDIKTGVEAVAAYQRETIASNIDLEVVSDDENAEASWQSASWFASRTNIPLSRASITATAGTSGSGEEKFIRDQEDDNGDQADQEGGQTNAHDFLKHITISRDQTRERKYLEEQLALQALLERKVEPSFEAFRGDAERSRGSLGVDAKDTELPVATGQRHHLYVRKQINEWIKETDWKSILEKQALEKQAPAPIDSAPGPLPPLPPLYHETGYPPDSRSEASAETQPESSEHESRVHEPKRVGRDATARPYRDPATAQNNAVSTWGEAISPRSDTESGNIEVIDHDLLYEESGSASDNHSSSFVTSSEVPSVDSEDRSSGDGAIGKRLYDTGTRQTASATSSPDESSESLSASGSSGIMSSRSGIPAPRPRERPRAGVDSTVNPRTRQIISQLPSDSGSDRHAHAAILKDAFSSSEEPELKLFAQLHSQLSGDYGDAQAWNGPPVDKVNVRHRIQELTVELENLKGQLGEDAELETQLPLMQDDQARPWKTIYHIKSKPYLGKPEWVHGDTGIKLGASMPVTNVADYLDRHPDIPFVVLKDYPIDTYQELVTTTDEYFNLDILPPPVPDTESIWIASSRMHKAMEALIETYPNFDTIFPHHDFKESIPAPYLCFFHMFAQWKDKVTQLKTCDQVYIKTLFEYLREVYIPIYEETLETFASGKFTEKHIPFLVKPGDILVQPKPIPQGFMATSWTKHLGIFTYKRKHGSSRSKGWDSNPRKRLVTMQKKDDLKQPGKWTGKDGAIDTKDSFGIWTVTGWNWVLNEGRLFKNEVTLELRTEISSTKVFNINELEWFPVQYAGDEIKELLLERGRKFWNFRTVQFVGYAPSTDGDDVLESANERFVIDFATYRMLHQESKKSTHKAEERDFDVDLMIQENPPEDDTINLFPSTLIGYNLRLKKWVDIEVDRIQDVNWNKKAFENLVVDEETKHLVKALISNQIKAEKSTDLISGKGNGLIILLHGGPGTGKTFTAESVAELAEKPLYRVTCGDIGTKPEDVEKYLESVLLLGKIWGCVVLLDEADVFLEERSLTDLKRNALVSVFLRILEYYDGILILTSNRVGTFDQAFKSRIQLALHYENLTKPQRRKIWRNFFNRLKDLGEQAIDFDDLYDHIDELAEHDMNGRQIRNAITTARQLAQFENKDFSYTQLKHAIKVAGKFEGYLKGVNQGFSDDQLARDSGFR